MRASSKRPRVESSFGVAPPPPSSSGVLTAEEFVDPTAAAAAPPPFTSDDLSICRMLGTVMTVQAAHGQLLVDVLAELQALRADLVSIGRLPPSPPFDNES